LFIRSFLSAQWVIIGWVYLYLIYHGHSLRIYSRDKQRRHLFQISFQSPPCLWWLNITSIVLRITAYTKKKGDKKSLFFRILSQISDQSDTFTLLHKINCYNQLFRRHSVSSLSKRSDETLPYLLNSWYIIARL